MTHTEFSLVNLLKAFWRFGWLLVLVMLVSGGTAWKFSSEQSPMYQATATVTVDSSQPRLTSLLGGLGTLLTPGYPQDVESQMMVIQSRSVLERAVTQLEPENAGNPEYIQQEASTLRSALKIAQVGTTSLVGVTVTSPDPVKAQKQANAVAEAYVSEAHNSMQRGIETALTNIIKERTKLSGSEIDLSSEPSLSSVTARIGATLEALKAATQRLGELKSPVATETPALLSEDAGTVLTPLRTISQQVRTAANEANALSKLAQEINWDPSALTLDFKARSDDVAVMEGQTRVLATKLETLSTEVEAMQRAETDPQVHGQLLFVEEQLGVASATAAATLQQLAALFEVEQQLRVAIEAARAIASQTGQSPNIVSRLAPQYEDVDLLRRIVQHSALVAITLESVSGQLQQIQSRSDTLKQWELESLSKRGASAIAVLDTLSRQLQPPSPGRGVILTSAELVTMEISAQAVAATIGFLLSEVEKTQMDTLDPQYPQYYTEMLSVREGLRSANGAAKNLPDEIAALGKGGASNLSYTTLDNLRQQLELVTLISSSGGARVLDLAMVSVPITEPFKGFRNVILAAAAALLLSMLTIMVLLYFDRKVRNATQVTSYVGLPMLASIPSIKATGSLYAPSILKGTPPGYLEAFRMLRTNLGLDSRRGQVVLISSPGEKEGKTTIAANLARAVALQGRKVLLIDGNLRNPGIAAAFGLIKVDGLSEFLTGEKEPQAYVKQADGVDILTVRMASEKSAEELSSPRMRALLEKARQVYDVVIVDSAPVMGYVDTRILAKAADDVLLVLQTDASMLDLARDSKQALETTGVRVVGFVLIQKKSEKSKNLPYLLNKRWQPQVGQVGGQPRTL